MSTVRFKMTLEVEVDTSEATGDAFGLASDVARDIADHAMARKRLAGLRVSLRAVRLAAGVHDEEDGNR